MRHKITVRFLLCLFSSLAQFLSSLLPPPCSSRTSEAEGDLLIKVSDYHSQSSISTHTFIKIATTTTTIMCMGVLLACISMHHMYAWHPRRLKKMAPDHLEPE